MTTIAYRNGVLAADSLATLSCDGRPIAALTNETHRKLIRIGPGTIAGCAGNWASTQNLIAWLKDKKGQSQPWLEQGECAIVIGYEGGNWIYEGRYRYPLEAEFTARGSGAAFALGAMAQGASATQAVRIAAQFDPGTGGSIQSMKAKGQPDQHK